MSHLVKVFVSREIEHGKKNRKAGKVTNIRNKLLFAAFNNFNGNFTLQRQRQENVCYWVCLVIWEDLSTCVWTHGNHSAQGICACNSLHVCLQGRFYGLWANPTNPFTLI